MPTGRGACCSPPVAKICWLGDVLEWSLQSVYMYNRLNLQTEVRRQRAGNTHVMPRYAGDGGAVASQLQQAAATAPSPAAAQRPGSALAGPWPPRSRSFRRCPRRWAASCGWRQSYRGRGWDGSAGGVWCGLGGRLRTAATLHGAVPRRRMLQFPSSRQPFGGRQPPCIRWECGATSGFLGRRASSPTPQQHRTQQLKR